METLISVIIPTYNRNPIILYTLELLRPQILRNSNEVELVVCNNASNDDSDSAIRNYRDANDFFSYIWYDDHVEVGVSIFRSIENATGRYVLLWGDDDVPAPYLIDTLLYYLHKNPEVGLIHFNGIVGNDGKEFSMTNLRIMNADFKNQTTLYNSKNFAENHYAGCGLMSSNLFLKSAWDEGVKIDSSKHYGYEFIAPILIGVKGKECLYLNFPLWIQRIPAYRAWQHKATLFWYVGIPNLLKDLENNGVIDDWSSLWHYKTNSKSLLLHVVPQMLLDKKLYKPYLKEIKSNQNSFGKKMFVNFVYYLVPPFIYKWVRNRHFKK